MFLELPKTVKTRKAVTGRIVTIDDIRNVLAYITRAYEEGRINEHRYRYYSAFVIFGALTGQRSESTIAQVTVGQFRDALRMDKPVLRVAPEQDKIRLGHEVPLHPYVVEAVESLLENRNDSEKAVEDISFLMWVKREKIPMSRFNGHFVLGDLRKFAEQHGDVIGWDQSNRAYILTHGVSGVEWGHYRHPLPEYVYDIYTRYRGDVRF